MDRRPNILLIMTDQQYGGAMSCAGNHELHTPGIDSLAEGGVLFNNSYCTYPLCIPARESIFTGRMPLEIGYREWGDSIDEKYQMDQMGHIFSQAGYECVYGGKLHTPGKDPSEHGFVPICEQNDNKLADACIEFLKQEHGKPFLMIASFDNPHNICEWARHQNLPWGNIPNANSEDCPNLPANHTIPPYEPELIRIIQKNFPRVYLPISNNSDEWRQYRNAYYRLIEKVDEQIERILQAIRQLNLDENTLIAFTSDHGDGHGGHQWNQKSILYEECIHVPLILNFNNETPQSTRRNEQLVSVGLDLLPTFCDYAGIEPPPTLPGRSLRQFVQGENIEDWRDELVVETWPFQGDPGRTFGRVLRTAKYKYIVYSWGRYREQLFDLENDPGEMVNLAVNTRYKDILQEHRTRLKNWCISVNDDFVSGIPE